MQYTKRIIVNKYELVLAYSIKWKSYPGDDGRYYQSEDVKYIKFELVNRMISRDDSESNYRGFTLLGIHVGIGHMKQTEQII
jgi:hypothetical protein